MQTVHPHIKAQSLHLGEHPFFADLRPQADLRRALAFAPILIPWVMSFQDVIRINAALAVDPSIRRQLQQHAAEDQGHEVWFLEDLRLLFGDSPRDVAWLFGRETAVMREAALAIASEVFRVRDDRLRLVLIEVIEAGFRTFIERVAPHVQASEGAEQLKYFAHTHEQVEAGHVKFESEMNLPDSVRSDAIAMVDRVFAEFARMAESARRSTAGAG